MSSRYQDINNTHLREAAKYLERALLQFEENTFTRIFYSSKDFDNYVSAALNMLEEMDAGYQFLLGNLKHLPEMNDAIAKGINQQFSTFRESQATLTPIDETQWPRLTPGAKQAATLALQEITAFYTEVEGQRLFFLRQDQQNIAAARNAIISILNTSNGKLDAMINSLGFLHQQLTIYQQRLTTRHHCCPGFFKQRFFATSCALENEYRRLVQVLDTLKTQLKACQQQKLSTTFTRLKNNFPRIDFKAIDQAGDLTHLMRRTYALFNEAQDVLRYHQSHNVSGAKKQVGVIADGFADRAAHAAGLRREYLCLLGYKLDAFPAKRSANKPEKSNIEKLLLGEDFTIVKPEATKNKKDRRPTKPPQNDWPPLPGVVQ